MGSRSKWVKPLLFFSVIGHELPLTRQVFVLALDFRITGLVGAAQTLCRLRAVLDPTNKKAGLSFQTVAKIGTKASDLGHYLPAPSSAVRTLCGH
jgi:hypothetical protein